MELDLKKTGFSSPNHNILMFSLCLLIVLLPSCQSVSDYSTLVYKNCANQSLMATANSISQTISSLFQELIRQSSNSNFFKQIAGNDGIFLSGLFQCRGDLSFKDCHDCVVQLEQISNSLCAESLSARVHLQGCYMLYEPDGDGYEFQEKSKHQLIHKVCSGGGGEPGAVPGGFNEMREAAFAGLEDGIANSVNGFYEMRYDGVEVMAQCQGDLWGCDCADCVGSAVEIVRSDCSGSVAGQVFLDNCFIGFSSHPHTGREKNDSGGKLAAVVLGAAATLGFVFIFFAFLKSCANKDDF